MLALIAESQTSPDSPSAIAAANPTAAAKPLVSRPGAAPTVPPASGVSCAPSPNAAPTATTSGSTPNRACGVQAVAHVPDTVTGTARRGAPAVVHSNSAAGSSTQAITVADVQAYVDHRIVPNGVGRIRYEGAVPTVSSLNCGSPSTVNAQLRSPVSVPESGVLCVADLHGDFVWATPNRAQSGPHHQVLRLVLDGQSGWLLETEIP